MQQSSVALQQGLIAGGTEDRPGFRAFCDACSNSQRGQLCKFLVQPSTGLHGQHQLSALPRQGLIHIQKAGLEPPAKQLSDRGLRAIMQLHQAQSLAPQWLQGTGLLWSSSIYFRICLTSISAAVDSLCQAQVQDQQVQLPRCS